jgi:hypothetical protein
MFGFGKLPCVVCDRVVPRKEALRLREHKAIVICKRCYDAWDRDGRKCKTCATPVRGTQEMGVFLDDHHGLGHADCGAARLVISL